MSTPFSRTMRSLNSDRLTPAVIGLLLAMVLLFGWGAWFVLAKISLYEVSQTMQIGDDNIIMAEFPTESLRRIKRGQNAHVRLKDITDYDQTIPAIVVNILGQNGQEKGHVELVMLAILPAPLPDRGKVTGQVDIEVEHLSPATLVMRASGQFLESPDPQSNRQFYQSQ